MFAPAHPKNLVSILLLGSFLAGCSMAPKYATPDVATPAQYKEASQTDTEGTWQKATENPGEADLSAWWLVFNDDALNALQDKAAQTNQDLKIAVARLEQARALAEQAGAAQMPKVDAGGSVSRGNLFGNTNSGKPTTNFSATGSVSYDPDLFGRLRDATQAARFDAEAQEALYRQARLAIHGDVAQNYFNLLSLDTERNLLSQTIVLREKSEKLLERRFKEGEVNEQDFLRSKAETASTRAELAALDQQRALVEHALAVLTGTTPSEFSMVNKELPRQLPIIPAGLPSQLLERRPDVAAAENQLKAANARIGVARAAFFPSISLSASGGFASNELGDLFKWSSRSWLLGPVFGSLISIPVFDGGLREAQLAVSKAQYQEAVATYRQQVLVAFKDVEDNLSSLRLQAEQAEHLYKAAEASSRASHLSDIRYEEGESSYLEVLDTQRDTLAAQRAYTRAQGSRFATTVALIRSLGGGWTHIQTSAEPTPEKPAENMQQKKDIAAEEMAAPEQAQQEAMPLKDTTAAPAPAEKPEQVPALVEKPVEKSVDAKPVAEKPADAPVEKPTAAPAPTSVGKPSNYDEMNPEKIQPENNTPADESVFQGSI